MRYVMRIAKLRESLKFWTHIAPQGYALRHTYLSVHKPNSPQFTLEVDYGVERLKPNRPALKYMAQQFNCFHTETFLVNALIVYIDRFFCMVVLIWGLPEDYWLKSPQFILEVDYSVERLKPSQPALITPVYTGGGLQCWETETQSTCTEWEIIDSNHPGLHWRWTIVLRSWNTVDLHWSSPRFTLEVDYSVEKLKSSGPALIITPVYTGGGL